MGSDDLIRAYYQRLGIMIPPKLLPDGETLSILHRNHVMMIPYENTDYLTRHITPCDHESQFREIILKRRGGMCMDNNTLFAELLKAIGYRVTCCSSMICHRDATQLRTHAMLIVEDDMGVCWWCDVANPFFRYSEPIPFAEDKEFSVPGGMLRIEKDMQGKYVLSKKEHGAWSDTFRIEHEGVTTEDLNEIKYSIMTKYPANHLCFQEVFSIVTPEGRRTLNGTIYRESAAERLYQYEVPSEYMPWAYAQFGLSKL